MMPRSESTSLVTTRRLLLLLFVCNGSVLPGIVFGVGWSGHERGHVLQLGEVEWGLLMGSGRPNGDEPTVARVTILPVVLVLGAAAEGDVQRKDEEAEQGADADRDVERRKVPVQVFGEERIIQVGRTFFDCR